MLLCRAAVDLSRPSLNYVAGIVRRHHRAIRSRWRPLNPGRPALPVLVHLRKAQADELTHLVLDGTLIHTDRVKADRPYFSGEHRVHGMNVQVIAGPDGTIMWTSEAMPGKIHDLTAARVRGVLRGLERAGILTLADKAYQGAEAPVVITPYKGKNKPESQKQANRSHAKLRGPGERANAQLKSWRILRKLRCSLGKAGHLVKAIARAAELRNHPRMKKGQCWCLKGSISPVSPRRMRIWNASEAAECYAG